MSDPTTSTLETQPEASFLQEALEFADRGFDVFPIWPAANGKCLRCGDKKCTAKPGKHPSVKWKKGATKERSQILKWWSAQWPTSRPDHYIGIATGERSDLLVLDIDVGEGKVGRESLAALELELGPLPETYTVETGSGGTQLYFRYPKGFDIRNTASVIGRHIDTRANGGVAVAPPSGHKSGGRYKVVKDLPLAQLPEAWVKRLVQKRRMKVAPSSISEGSKLPPATPRDLERAKTDISKIKAIQGEGGNTKAWRAMATLRIEHGLTDAEARPLAEEWNKSNAFPEFPPDELEVLLHNGVTHGQHEVGSERDPVEIVHQSIIEWKKTAKKDRDPMDLVEQVRKVKIYDSAQLEVIKRDVKAATGIGTRAQGIHLTERPRVVTADVGPDFDLSATRIPLDNVNNVVKAMGWLKIDVHYDEFAHQVVKGDGTSWTDSDTDELNITLQSGVGLRKMPQRLVYQGVSIHAQRRRRNPMREWLGSLKWDSTRRIAELFAKGFGAECSEYAQAASTNFMRSMVARALKPGCKVDTMVVLEGPQGILKSTALKALAGPSYCAEINRSPNDKDFYLALNGNLIDEVAELESFSRAEVTAIKNTLSTAVDHYRVPYGHVVQAFPRQGVFVGTTNKDDYLRDETGNRRFWPIKCTKIDLEWITANREQLFAEAVADILAGESWWVMPKDETLAEQEQRHLADPWEEILAVYLADHPEVVETTSSDLLKRALFVMEGDQTTRTQMRAATVLKRLEWYRDAHPVYRPGVEQKQRYWHRPKPGVAPVKLKVVPEVVPLQTLDAANEVTTSQPHNLSLNVEETLSEEEEAWFK